MSALLPVIGFEIHVELATESKMFCACANSPFDLPPNTALCPVCLGLPGALPSLNRRALLLGLRAALMLDCQIAQTCCFDRKNYAYPDLVKGYQITQYRHPLARGGLVKIPGRASHDSVFLTRIHLEEDTAKLTHGKDRTTMDCNRSGVPLLEIVTAPCIRTIGQADAFLRELRSRLVRGGISHCRMQRGEMRIEANVSVAKAGTPLPEAWVEIKNQSSFRFVREALSFEIQRLSQKVAKGEKIRRETRGWDADKERTFLMRSKEKAADYRYFPEPDLPPFAIKDVWIQKERTALPESVESIVARWTQAGIAEDMLRTFSNQGQIDFFDAAAKTAPEIAGGIAGALLREVSALVNQSGKSIDESALTPEALAGTMRLARAGKIGASAVSALLAELFERGGQPEALAERKGLFVIDDICKIEATIRTVLAENPTLTADFRAGKMKVRKALFGKIMAALKGRALPEIVDKLLTKHLGG